MRVRVLVGVPCVLAVALALAGCGTTTVTTTPTPQPVASPSPLPSPSRTASVLQSLAIDRFVALLAPVERHDRKALACFTTANLVLFSNETKAAVAAMMKAFNIEPKPDGSKQRFLAEYYAACVTYTTKCLVEVHNTTGTGDTPLWQQWAKAAIASERRAARALKVYRAYVRQLKSVGS